MKEGKVFFLAAGISAVAALSARAVEAPPVPGAPPAKIRFDAVYNTNVSASSATFAALRGLKPADEIYSPALDLNYFKQLGIQSFFLQGTGGYDFYQRNTILNRERIETQAGTTIQAEDCSATTSGSYARRQSDLQDLSVVTTKNTQEDIAGTLSATCFQTGTLTPSGAVTQTWSNNSALVRQTSDYRSLAAQGSILYKMPDLGEISLFGQYSETEFPHRLLILAGTSGEDGYKLYAGGIRVKHDFGAQMTLMFSVSQTSLRSDGGAGANFDGITYETTITYQPTPRLQTELHFGRQTNPSNRLDASYSIDELYQADVAYTLTDRLTAKLGASDTRKTYEGVALVPGVDLSRERMKSVFGSIVFNVTPRTSVSLDVNFDDRRADVIGYSYTGTRIGLIFREHSNLGKKAMMKRLESAIAFGLLFLCVAATTANAQAPTPAPAQQAVLQPPEQSYILGPDDVLQVDALGRTDFSTKAKIGSDGTIQLPYLGTVEAANRSMAQLRDQITQALQKGGYFAKPIVQVEVVSYASRYVTVLGSVTNPGLIPVDRPYRLSEIIARVGGIREDGASYIIVRSGKGDERSLEVKDLATGDGIADPYVQPGDKIYSPKADIFYIKGQVKAPGEYPTSPNMTLVMALARGGGLTDLGSDSHIKIIRKNETITPPDLNVKIQPNDVIDVGQGWF